MQRVLERMVWGAEGRVCSLCPLSSMPLVLLYRDILREEKRRGKKPSYVSGPKPFWHQAPVFWKTIFHGLGWRGMILGWFSQGACNLDPSHVQFTVGFVLLRESNADLMGDRAQAVL